MSSTRPHARRRQHRNPAPAPDVRRLAWQIVNDVMPRLATDLWRREDRLPSGDVDNERIEATLLLLVVTVLFSRQHPRGKLSRSVREATAHPITNSSVRNVKSRGTARWSQVQAELVRLGLPGWPIKHDERNVSAAWPTWRMTDVCLGTCLDLIHSVCESTSHALGSHDGTLINTTARCVTLLGALREALLECNLVGRRPTDDERIEVPTAWRVQRSMERRRSRGSYFTPERLTRWLVRHAVLPAWRAWLRAAAAVQRATSPPCIIDPAMGTGYFLVAAHSLLTARFERLAQRNPNHPALRQIGANAGSFVLDNCLWGMDSDPVAVAAARVGLWLAAGAPRRAPGIERLRHGDALIGPAVAPSGYFDVVVGNPPYGKPLDQAYRRAVRSRFAGCQQNADLSVAFVNLARDLARPSGRIGLVLPKALTYSAAWRHLRRQITPEIVALCDVECGWREVRLEQVLVVLSPGALCETYVSARADRAGFVRGPRCTTAIAARLDTLPVGTHARDWRRFERLRCDTLMLGDICKTVRGLPAQNQLRSKGSIRVLGGRDLVPFGWRSTSGFLAAADVPAEVIDGPRLLFQNIVAHVLRPRPHLRLIGTWHAGGVATLDTVNNLVARRGDFDLWAMLALLHSKLVNWYVYTFVYNRAIRTMHFDQCFLDKIPLPARLDEYATTLAAAARHGTKLTSAWCDKVGYDRERPRQSICYDRLSNREASEVGILEAELREVQRKIDSLARRAYGLAAAD